MAASTFSLGEWRVEPDLNLLIDSDGEETHLEPKLMDVLVYLANRPGEVVSSDDIVDAVWGGQPMSDNPVYSAIGRLRQALGDDPKHPRYIQTIASRGYRIVADVSRREAPGPARRTDRRRSLLGYLAGAAIVVAIAAGVALLYDREPTEAPEHILISSFPGSHEMPSFSPDGSRIAYVSDESGHNQIWLLDLATNERRQITDNKWSSRPRWSPVADEVLYHGDGIWLVSAAGGDDRQLVSSGRNPDWAPDGNRFAFERSGEVWTANRDGSDQLRVEGLPTRDLALAERRPVYSPDGMHVAFFHAPVSPLGDWWIVPADGGSPRQVTFDKARSGWATWTDDGRGLIVSSQRAGSRTLWKMPIDGGKAEPVLIGPGDDDDPDIVGDRLVYSTRQTRFTLCVTDFETGETRELYSSANDIALPRFSPDDTEVAFFAMLETGDIQILAVDKNGGKERYITTDKGARNQAHEWSADGTAMYFYRLEPSPAYMRNDANGGPSELVADGWNWIKENGAQVHPTKPKVIYSRLDRGFATQTLVRDLESGTETLFPKVLFRSRWSNSGDRLVAMQESQGRLDELVVCDEYGTECESLGQNGWEPKWSADDSRITYEHPRPEGMTIFTLTLATGEVETRGRIGPLMPIGTFFDVSSEDEIAWVRYDRGTGELWLTRIDD